VALNEGQIERPRAQGVEDTIGRAGGKIEFFIGQTSGLLKDRPGLTEMKKALRAGDTLVVWRLDRLERSLPDLLEWVAFLEAKGVALRSLHESIDTSTSTGKLVFHLFASLAEFERNLIRERTLTGLASARARGRLGGRPPSLTLQQRQALVTLYEKGELTVKQLCEMFHISKPTLYAYLDQYHQQKPD
jgi:DNA invertase Pin-like site-specific DNA recombinase